MYVGEDFPDCEPLETLARSFDFVNDLDASEEIASVVFTLEVVEGTDPSPASHIYLSPSISGSIVTQRLQNLLGGVTYRLTATITTGSQNSPVLHSHIRCRTPT